MANIRASLELDTKQAKKDVDKLGTALKALASAAVIKGTLDLANNFQSLSNRLRSVTASTAEYNKALENVKRLADSSRSSLSATADLYSSLTIASEDLALSQDQVAKITDTFSKTLKISGAETGAAAGAMIQFGQALAAGVLRGDEFNSINETNSKFMGEFAKILGVGRGELRKMAEQGLLTAGIVAQAAQIMNDSINEDFGKTLPTISESFQGITNELTFLIGEIEAKTGVFSGLSKAIRSVADNLEIIIPLLGAAFGAAAAARLVTFVQGMQLLAKVQDLINGKLKIEAVLRSAINTLTGAGIAKVAAAGAVGIGVYAGLNALLQETNDELDQMAGKDSTFVGPPLPDDMAEARRKQRDDERVKNLRQQLIEQQKISAAEAEAKRRDNERTRTIEKNLQKSKEILETTRANIDSFTQSIALETEMLGLSEREKENKREIADIEAERAEKVAELRAMEFDKDAAKDAELRAEKIAEINALYDEQIDKTERLRDEYHKMSTSFGTGFQEAFANFTEMVEDEAAYAQRLFDTMANGFTDAITNFVETGKLSFKDLFKTLMMEIIKMQANRLFLALFDPTGGLLTNLFAGFFAQGGSIPAGKFGIAGEAGPEIIRGPASVTSTNDTAEMLGRSTNITYNIQAVDAPSFQALVARDPEFIYNVTRAGARRIPGGAI